MLFEEIRDLIEELVPEREETKRRYAIAFATEEDYQEILNQVGTIPEGSQIEYNDGEIIVTGTQIKAIIEIIEEVVPFENIEGLRYTRSPVTWEEYEAIDQQSGESRKTRFSYMDGVLEIRW
ncbi:MAG: hypothetical protein AB4372_35875 [Xenococcus sp. (in: cyanobacteria)]